MPIHDWTRVDAGLFHAFHHNWITSLSAALNAGVLPPDYYALPEQTIGGPVPDVLALRLPPPAAGPHRDTTGLAVAEAPPPTPLTPPPQRRGADLRAEGRSHRGAPPARIHRGRGRDRLARQQGERLCAEHVRREDREVHRGGGPSAGDRPLPAEQARSAGDPQGHLG